MPSQANIDSKKVVIAELTEKFKNATSCVLVNYSGISVENDTKLRAEFRKADVEYVVAKNTMIRFALKEAGIEGLDELLNGNTALAISKDATTAAKIVCEFAEKNDYYEVKGGFMDGKAIDKATVEALAKIPSKEVLIARLLGSFKAPLSNFVYLLNAIAEKNA
ncbi:MAG: 50S ribosomal protein L10 [Clostridia bacterium]|nr:50S ribosomal protein L10 [Clostridia bacterium]MBR2328198.1 50S ribosomal protein L10 [Clostridia bacterium]